MEYELTNKSDAKGNVPWKSFLEIFEQLQLMKNLSEEELRQIYTNNLNDEKKLHVQTFANDLRDQMSEDRENIVIDLFDRLCGKKGKEILNEEDFRKAFDA